MKDRDFLVVCSVRYCLGRDSYIVSSMTDYLKKNAKLLHPADRAVIVRDIEECDDYGDEMVKREWTGALAALNAAGGKQ